MKSKYYLTQADAEFLMEEAQNMQLNTTLKSVLLLLMKQVLF